MNSHKNSNSQVVDELQETEIEIIGHLNELQTITESKNDTWVYDYLNVQSSSTPPNNMYPKYNQQTNYYQEFWRTYLINEMMITKIKEFSSENQVLNIKLDQLDNLHQQYNRLLSVRNQQQNRRTANLINQNHVCPYQECKKLYGSEVSLNLHIKLKHNGGNQTERERLAREICQAQEIGAAVQSTNINFPPGYLEQFKESLFSEKDSTFETRFEDESDNISLEKFSKRPLEISSPNLGNILKQKLSKKLVQSEQKEFKLFEEDDVVTQKLKLKADKKGFTNTPLESSNNKKSDQIENMRNPSPTTSSSVLKVVNIPSTNANDAMSSNQKIHNNFSNIIENQSYKTVVSQYNLKKRNNSNSNNLSQR